MLTVAYQRYYLSTSQRYTVAVDPLWAIKRIKNENSKDCWLILLVDTI
jgi:hypothetical protein